MLVRAAFGYLPMAFILAGVAIAATGLLVAITDDISAAVVSEPRHRAVRQPAAGGRRRLQERARRELGHPAVRRLPRRDHPRDRRVRALARDDHPRRGDLHLRLLPAAHLRRDDLARDEPLGATARRAARRDHPRQVRHRLDPHPRHRGDRQHRRRGRRQHHLRADDRRRGAPRPRRLVAVRAPAADPDDGGRRRERRRASARPMSERRRIGRHPEPRRLHATGDGPELAAVDVTGAARPPAGRRTAAASTEQTGAADERTPRHGESAAAPATQRRGARAGPRIELVRRHRLPDGQPARARQPRLRSTAAARATATDCAARVAPRLRRRSDDASHPTAA